MHLLTTAVRVIKLCCCVLDSKNRQIKAEARNFPIKIIGNLKENGKIDSLHYLLSINKEEQARRDNYSSLSYQRNRLCSCMAWLWENHLHQWEKRYTFHIGQSIPALGYVVQANQPVWQAAVMLNQLRRILLKYNLSNTFSHFIYL